MGVLLLGAILTVVVSRPLQLAGPRMAGLYAGALTNTPALAAARETLRERGYAAGMTAGQLRLVSDEPVIAYSLAYPLGVVGVLACFQFVRRVWKVKLEPAEHASEIRVRDFVVENPAAIGHTLQQILQPYHDAGFVVGRLHRGGHSHVAAPDLVLEHGDIVVVTGEADALQHAEAIFGVACEAHVEQDRSELDIRRIFVSNHEIAGKRIAELDLPHHLGAQITRVRRGDVDVVATAETRLELGDRVRVLTRRENIPAISQFFGDSIKGTAETDFGSVAVGMVLGVLVGMLPIPLPGGHAVRLGLAGGPLVVSLVLGRLQRTGKMTWIVPASSNLTLRQIGFLLFLSGVGIRSGYQFGQTLRTNGVQMLAAGAVVTFAVTLATLVIGYKFLKVPFASLMGLVSGIQTQPACLAYAVRESNSDAPNLAYASVFPLAMILKILIAQLLA
jgi:putative transport protein